MTPEQIAALIAENAALQASNAALTAAVADKSALSIKVSAKGAVQIDGFGRWPVTLYKGQIVRLIEDSFVAKIRQFIVDNDALLSEKPTRTATEKPVAA